MLIYFVVKRDENESKCIEKVKKKSDQTYY